MAAKLLMYTAFVCLNSLILEIEILLSGKRREVYLVLCSTLGFSNAITKKCQTKQLDCLFPICCKFIKDMVVRPYHEALFPYKEIVLYRVAKYNLM